MSVDIAKLEGQVHALNPEALMADGLEDSIIGIVVNNEGIPVVAYSIPKILAHFMEHDEFTHEEAYEYFEFNIAGAYMGDGTPVYLDVMEIVPLEN